MKHLLVLAAIVFFPSHPMHKDKRVWLQMDKMGIGSHVGSDTPIIQADSKKIYVAKGPVPRGGADRIIRVRYHANDTLDTSFGQNGVEIGEIIEDFSSYKLPGQLEHP